MGYQALYRTWRPRTFRDVVGQEHITRTLQNAIVQEKFTHAYLFSGPRGTGKTSAAKIFANAINCERGPSEEPCNECAACIGIQDGTISDVIEIDAASNTSVDDIREIRDKVKYASSVVPYKVYIIDEVHMISVNAFNALLKTLEEPPKHVVFILATTEPHKIPLTIISRCQRFDFRPISSQTIVGRMREIATEEGIAATDEALETIALAAEGGMRDALSTLDQAVSYSDGEVTLDDVLAVTGSVSQDLLINVTETLMAEDTKGALQALDEMLRGGKDPARFVFDLIYFFRDLLLYNNTGGASDILERARVDDAFTHLSEAVESSWLKNAILEMNNCQQEIKWTNSPKVFVEIALLQIATGSGSEVHSSAEATTAVAPQAIGHLTQQVSELQRELKSLQESAASGNQAVSKEPEQRRPQPRPGKSEYRIPFDRIRNVLQEASRQALQDSIPKWGEMLGQLRDLSAPAHAKVVESRPVAASETALVVAFKYVIHCSLYMDNREMIENVLTQVVGKPLEIIPIPYDDWKKLREEYVQSQDKEEIESGGPDSEADEAQEKPKQEDLVVEEARKLFGEDLVEVHE